MDLTHLHLILNHFPIIGTLIGGSILLFGVIFNRKTVQVVGAIIIVLVALIAIPVYLTGESAEERVENLPGVSENYMEAHEEAAEMAIILITAAGLASLVALFTYQRASARAFFSVATVLTLVAFGAMARTGYLGGQIRHTEIRADSLTQANH